LSKEFVVGSADRAESLPGVAIASVKGQAEFVMAYQVIDLDNPKRGVGVDAAVYKVSGTRLFATTIRTNTGVNGLPAATKRRMSGISTRPSVDLADEGGWVVAYVAAVGQSTGIFAAKFTPTSGAGTHYSREDFTVTRPPGVVGSPNIKTNSGGNFGVAYEYFDNDTQNIATATVAVRNGVATGPQIVANQPGQNVLNPVIVMTDAATFADVKYQVGGQTVTKRVSYPA
jgi:hypothetical protein